MAGIAEMALGIASVLRSGAVPNPLPVELCGHAPEDAAQLVKLVIDERVDAPSDSGKFEWIRLLCTN